MKFEELNTRLENSLIEDGINEFTPAQEKLIKLLKQGKNTLIFTTIDDNINRGLYYLAFMKAPEMLEGSPRVLWITPTPEHAKTLVSEFKKTMKRSDVTIEIADNKGKMIEQRNAIFDGTEILLGNPKRLLDLYNQNGYHVNQITLLIIDHVDELCKDPLSLQSIRRIVESLPKCQKLLIAQGKHNRLGDFSEEICTFYETSEI